MQKILPAKKEAKRAREEQKKTVCRRLHAKATKSQKKTQPAEWKHCWSTLNARFATPKTRKHCVSVRCVFALALNIAPCSRCAHTLRDSVGRTERERERERVCFVYVITGAKWNNFFSQAILLHQRPDMKRSHPISKNGKQTFAKPASETHTGEESSTLECYSLCGTHK